MEEIPNLATLLKTGYSLGYDPYSDCRPPTAIPLLRPGISSNLQLIEAGTWLKDMHRAFAQWMPLSENFPYGHLTPFIAARIGSGQPKYLLPNLRGIGGLGVGEDMGLLSLIRMIPCGFQTFRLDCLVDASPAIFTQVLKTIQDTPFDCLTSITIRNSPIPARNSEIVASIIRLQLNLEKLDLTGFQLTAISLATFGYHARLTKLYIRHRGESLQTMVELFGVIGASFPKLRNLNVWLDDDLTDEAQVSSLAGISSCCELRRLRIYCDGSENFTSQMVLEMGRWWPSMEVFQIGGDPDVVGKACAPLSLLQDIVQVWATTLQSLFIAFNPGDQLLSVPESNHVKFHKLEFILFAGPLPHYRLVNTALLAVLTTQDFYVRDNGFRSLARQSMMLSWNEVSPLNQALHRKYESEARKD